MAAMVRDRAISPVELVQAYLEQIERCNPTINAFTVILAEQALVEARAREHALARGERPGLLHGVPLTVKDSFDLAGQATRAGSRSRLGHRAAEDAPAVARLRSEGAVILGKTNTPELLAAYETDNFLTGRTNNPWDADRTPGGSSGGEAAAIAAFCSAGGIATDGGGSIRVPAHFCGVAGLKPTPGRIPASGHFPSLGYPGGLTGVAGPMARSAEDLRLLFSVLVGYDPSDPFSTPVPLQLPVPLRGGRIGIWEQFYDVPVDPEIREAVRKAAGLLEDIGFTLEEFAPRGMERAPNLWAFLFSQWPSLALRKLVEGRERELHWTLAESLAASKTEPPTAMQVLAELAARDRMRASLLTQMKGMAAVLMPVCGIPAFRHRERKWDIAGRSAGLFQVMMPAVVANVMGLPAITVPLARTHAGLPAGVQLMGLPYQDEQLLEMAALLEEARGPWSPVP